MKTNGKHEVISQIARQSLVLAALLAMVLSTAGISHAQSSAPSSVGPAAKPAAAPAPALPAAKGQHEGIKVHGHWTIEVKNPDGKVVTHREFENALDPNEGADLLTGVLSGEYSPSGFYILLGATSSGQFCGGVGACFLEDTRDPLSCQLCNGTVTYTPNMGTSNAIGFTLTGSSAPPSGTIGSVATGVNVCMPTPDYVSQQVSYMANAAFSTQFATLPPGQVTTDFGSCPYELGGSYAQGAPLNLTSAVVNPVVVVTAPQTVSVRVVITFGSGQAGS